MIEKLKFLLLAMLLAGCGLPGSVVDEEGDRPELTSLAGLPPARVVDVVDGDTIRVELDGKKYTVRYIGVDTPETVHPERPVEWMGPEASAANKKLVEDQVVYLEKDVSETDRYGRLLRYVYLADGTLVNAELVRLGYAQASTFPPDVKYQELLSRAERDARQAGRGLWAASAESSPVATRATAPRPLVVASPRPAAAGVVIVVIQADGAGSSEPDEYAALRNDGPAAIDLAGWRLNAGSDGQDFFFPAFRLQPGQVCRVYTDELHPESCGFSFGSGQALWRNGGDCARLYDPAGRLVAETCY